MASSKTFHHGMRYSRNIHCFEDTSDIGPSNIDLYTVPYCNRLLSWDRDEPIPLAEGERCQGVVWMVTEKQLTMVTSGSATIQVGAVGAALNPGDQVMVEAGTGKIILWDAVATKQVVGTVLSDSAPVADELCEVMLADLFGQV